MYYGKVRIYCDLERGHCHSNHAIKATKISETENHCRIYDVGRSHARMIKFQKRYFIETLENNETNSGHKHTPHMYSSCFQKHLYDESALSSFEVVTKPLYKCNEDRPYYAKTFLYRPYYVNIKTFLYNTRKILILSRENRHPTLITHT